MTRHVFQATLSAVIVLGLFASAVPAQTIERRYEPGATGAVTVIYPGDIAMGSPDMVSLLQWNVPGLMVQRFGNGVVSLSLRNDCAPPPVENPDPESIRNPLLIIDGVRVMNANVSSEIRTLNPFLVDRIDVVRDMASAAVYGIRARCGVIRIFTRRAPR
jgi:outer membrane receptor protein involved in Fe transport